MDIEFVSLDEFNSIYAVVGETLSDLGDSTWVVRLFRYKKDAEACLKDLKSVLADHDIPEDIYRYTHVILPANFMDQDAIMYHECGGIYYSIHTYEIS